MIAASNSIGRDDTVMVDTKDIDRILDKLDNEVIPGISGLDKRLAIVETRLESEKRSHEKEDTERLDLIRVHDRILRGYNGTPGLISTVKDLKDWIDTRAGYEKLFITGIIAQGLGVAFLVVKTLLGI